jgi:hypothetical protein
MDFSTDIPMLGYFIYRSGDQADPTALEFCPPKGSDELHDALRIAYPHVKTHSDRMRNAVIEFLKQELTDEQNHMAASVTSLDNNISTYNSWHSWPSIDSTASTLSSPDTLYLPTPASMTLSYTPSMSRQNSTSQANTTTPKTKTGLEEMTSVFSLSSTSQPKTHVRRKMTESELVEYRKRRIVKACDSCKARKRKCQHNQTDMEKVQSSKVTKSKARASNPSSARTEQITKALVQPTELSDLTEDPFIFLDQSLFGDLPTTDSGLFDVSDNLFAPRTIQPVQDLSSTTWPWSETPDWTLIDTDLQTHVLPSSPSYHQALFPAPTGLLSPQPTPQLELVHEVEQSTFMGLSSPGDTLSSNQLRDHFSTLATRTGNQSSLSSGSVNGESVLPTTISQHSLGSQGLVSSVRPDGLFNVVGHNKQPSKNTGTGIDGGRMIYSSDYALTQVTDGQAHATRQHVMTDVNSLATSAHTNGTGTLNLPALPSHLNMALTSRAATSHITSVPAPQGHSASSSSAGHGSPRMVRGLSLGLVSPGLSSRPVLASSPSSAPTASRGNGEMALQEHAVTSAYSEASTQEAPLDARPSSLLVDSTSTSTASSTFTTVPTDAVAGDMVPDGHTHAAAAAANMAARPSQPSSRSLAQAPEPETQTATASTSAYINAHQPPTSEEPSEYREETRAVPLKSGSLVCHNDKLGHADEVALAAEVHKAWLVMAMALVDAVTAQWTSCCGAGDGIRVEASCSALQQAGMMARAVCVV